jgi:esterase
MDLAFRDFGGNGTPILILHGLFGSAQNWASIARSLAAHGRCIGLDLRNHGQSPHAPTHSLADCVADLRDWVARHSRGSVRLIGHSMGGLVAMGFAISHPDLADAVAVIDIAPRQYPLDHEREFAALRTDIGGCASRADLDMLLAPVLPEQATRQFLLTNAVRTEDGKGFRWRLNVAALASSSLWQDFRHVQGSFDGPALFVAGGRSDYLRGEDRPSVLRRFPRASFEVIPEADHWPQVSAPRALQSILEAFLACNKTVSLPSLKP